MAVTEIMLILLPALPELIRLLFNAFDNANYDACESFLKYWNMEKLILTPTNDRETHSAEKQ